MTPRLSRKPPATRLTDFHYEYRLSPEFEENQRLLEMADRRGIQRLSHRKKVQRKRLLKVFICELADRVGKAIANDIIEAIVARLRDGGREFAKP